MSKNHSTRFKFGIVAVLLTLSLLLCACGSQKADTPDKDKDQNTEQTIPAGVDLELIKDGEANFEIVLPEDPSETEQKAAETLKARVKSAVSTADAKIVSAGKYDEKKVEVLI